MASLVLDVQVVLEDLDENLDAIPTNPDFSNWISVALSCVDRCADTELTLRIVSRHEIVQLNEKYRGKVGATNVLSFPFEVPEDVMLSLIGDVVICLPVIVEEAATQGKKIKDHLMHIVVHGVLHLLGYDHIDLKQAKNMEELEIVILEKLGVKDPYKDINAI